VLEVGAKQLGSIVFARLTQTSFTVVIGLVHSVVIHEQLTIAQGRLAISIMLLAIIAKVLLTVIVKTYIPIAGLIFIIVENDRQPFAQPQIITKLSIAKEETTTIVHIDINSKVWVVVAIDNFAVKIKVVGAALVLVIVIFVIQGFV
jgi:hypothetical protein